MITSLFQRDLTIFYRTHRATMNAGNTLNARIGPFRFSVTRQGNRTGRTDLRTDAARDTGIRSIKSVAAYRKVSEQRIDHIALQKRDTSRIIQRGISLCRIASTISPTRSGAFSSFSVSTILLSTSKPGIKT